MNEKTKMRLSDVIQMLKKTMEIIHYAYQLSHSIKIGTIKPEHIEEVVHEVGDESFVISRDWQRDEEFLKEDFADATKINIISYQILVCKESYASLFIKGNPYGLSWAKKEESFELYSAQTMLECIRHALGHLKLADEGLIAFATWDFKDANPGRLEIKSIGVILDCTNLQGKMFEWKDIGGINNFIKILKFLIEDLSNRLLESPKL